MDDPSPTPVGPRTLEPEPAGVWLRTEAFAADLALISLCLYSLEWMAWTISSTGFESSMPWIRRAGIPIYFAFTTVRFFQTPGQSLAGIRISRVDFHPLSVGKGLLRTLLFFLFLPLFPISLITMLANKRRRALHDFACQTWALEIPAHSFRLRAVCRAVALIFLAYCCLQFTVSLADFLESWLAPDFGEVAAGAEKIP